MTLQQLRYAIVISEVGSMNKASEVLYIAQPSLTSAIKELEFELGITIFNRTSRGITLTADGIEFITYARQIYQQYQIVRNKYVKGQVKRKFGVSAQHYSFAIQAFIDTVNQFNTHDYEFAIRETKTAEVIDDVVSLKSEIGIIYLSDFNKKVITQILNNNQLSFTHLLDCGVYAFIAKSHPLANQETVSIKQLEEYPCLTFEQGDKSSFYYAEEIVDTSEFARVIKACDRSTMLNLMKGVNGYTFCSGIICNNLNGEDYTAIPISDKLQPMEIGYITRKNSILSEFGEIYIQKLKEFKAA